jgi:hypothetical protein
MAQIHKYGIDGMNFLRYGMLALALIVAIPAVAQAQSTSTEMQILANKVNADKKALVAQNMELTETEAKSFWPIYDAYQQDLQKINIRMTQTILERVYIRNKERCYPLVSRRKAAEVEITPDMSRAGLIAYEAARDSYANFQIVELVYIAMRRLEAPGRSGARSPASRRNTSA